MHLFVKTVLSQTVGICVLSDSLRFLFIVGICVPPVFCVSFHVYQVLHLV
jgi:hypothetical protein